MIYFINVCGLSIINFQIREIGAHLAYHMYVKFFLHTLVFGKINYNFDDITFSIVTYSNPYLLSH